MVGGMRRRTVLVALAGLAVVGAAGVVVLSSRPSQVTLENCQRIREGMTRFDVELILGGPPGDYRTKPTWAGSHGQTIEDDMRASCVYDDGQVAHWNGDGFSVVVLYDGDGRVLYADSEHVGVGTPSVLDTWRWRLNRQWHRWFP
jgi:hypothetical protein